MEEISVKGEKYIKAAVIAANFGYTSDYVGQLCRSGQVKATLVGRSWYVNEESLRGHKKGRYRSTLAKSKEAVRRVAAEKAISSGPRFMQRVLRYEADEGELIPTIAKEEVTEETPEETFIETTQETRNVENKGLNEVSTRSAEKKIFQPTLTRPSVRVISAQANRADLRSRSSKATGGINIKQPHSRLATPVAVTCALLLSSGLFLALAGLDKRVVDTGSESSLVLYGFDLAPATAAMQSLIGSGPKKS